MLNFGPQETDLGSRELRARRGGCLATCQKPGGEAGGSWQGLDVADALSKQNETKNKLHLDSCGVCAESRKPRFSGVGSPVQFPACVVAPGNTHFNSDMSEVGPVRGCRGEFASGVCFGNKY